MPLGQERGRGESAPASRDPVRAAYLRRRLAVLATFFSVEPPDFFDFLPPVALPPTAFLICFSMPDIRQVTLPSKSFCYPRFYPAGRRLKRVSARRGELQARAGVDLRIRKIVGLSDDLDRHSRVLGRRVVLGGDGPERVARLHGVEQDRKSVV